MALQDVDDFEDVREVAEKDDVAAIGEAAEVRADFWTGAAEGAGQGGKFPALLA